MWKKLKSSSTLWLSLIAIATIIVGMATGTITVEQGIEQIKIIVLAYLGKEGIVNTANILKNRKAVNR
ncbi:MAG: hypothetical protein ACOZAL_02730 [Patescibacteria group bacterium]